MKTNFLNPEMERMSRAQLTALQQEKLIRMIRYTAANNAFHRERYRRAGIDPETFRGIEDMPRVPMMSKTDFRDQYPDGMCCVPKKRIVEMHQSSGSTGTPVVMLYTMNDIRVWGECVGRCYRMAGAEPGDVLQITPTLGLFNGGLGCFHGGRAAEMFIVPASSGNTVRQIKLINDFQTKVLVAVVSYGSRIMEVAEEMKVKMPSLKIGIFGAEAFSDGMKEKLRNGLGIDVFDVYGMTETGGIGTLGQDCPEHCGIHLWEDHFYVEVIDPATGEILPDGREGELVVTSLSSEAIPVIRFRTGDLTSVISRETCACGRTHLRLAPITARRDDMIIIKGVNCFPKQIEQSLLKVKGVLPNYQILLDEVNGVTNMHIKVEAEPGVTGYMVEKQLKEDLGFSPGGEVLPPGFLPRQEGKAKRVFRLKNGVPVA